jgi:hypothetical protein
MLGRQIGPQADDDEAVLEMDMQAVLAIIGHGEVRSLKRRGEGEKR